MEHWSDRNRNKPLGYITKMRFYHDQLGLPGELPGTGAIARALIGAGAPVNQADAEWQRLPLHVAVRNGRAGSIRRLLAHGADPRLPGTVCTKSSAEGAPQAGVAR
jgi:hypothetical protein